MKTTEKMDALQAQRDKLQGLCRALQIERNDLRKDLAVATSASTGLSAMPDTDASESASETPQ
jgi:cell division protein FtsL